MNSPTTPEEIARWDRWFAIEMNNLAWDLSERPDLTDTGKEEMLNAAHASALHWSRVGTPLNRARSEMLLGHVHALCGNGSLAIRFAQRSFAYITGHDSPEWEIAFAHAILAHAATAAGDPVAHANHYALAQVLGQAIENPSEREIFQRTFARVPPPAQGSFSQPAM